MLLFFTVLLIVNSTMQVFALETGAQDILKPAALDSVRIGGRLGEKLDRCVTNRLLAQDIELVVAPYREKSLPRSAGRDAAGRPMVGLLQRCKRRW